jgi:hypothetical protein
MTKYRGYRMKLLRNTTGTTYVQVGQLLELGDVGSNRSLIDVTGHGDEWTDNLAGIQDGSEVTVRLAFDHVDAQHTALKADYDTGAIKKFHLEHPDMTGTNNGVEFTAISTAFIRRSALDGAVEAEVTLKIVNPGVVLYTTS